MFLLSYDNSSAADLNAWLCSFIQTFLSLRMLPYMVSTSQHRTISHSSLVAEKETKNDILSLFNPQLRPRLWCGCCLTDSLWGRRSAFKFCKRSPKERSGRERNGKKESFEFSRNHNEAHYFNLKSYEGYLIVCYRARQPLQRFSFQTFFSFLQINIITGASFDKNLRSWLSEFPLMLLPLSCGANLFSVLLRSRKGQATLISDHLDSSFMWFL
jgi:hypothetical protein